MEIVVTGATGYIGRRFLVRAQERGHFVVAASRTPVPGASAWQRFDLASNQAITLPRNAEAIVHLAANTSPRDSAEADRELIAARKLLDAARRLSAKFVFVSSQTARPDAPTLYGQTKWRIEQDVLSAGGWVVRPGLVYGGAPRGLFGELMHTVQRFPVLPAFVPAPAIQPIHVDDLAAALIEIVCRSDIEPGVLRLACPEPVSFTSYLRALASDRLRTRRIFVPVPVVLLRGVAQMLRRHAGFGSAMERLRSLLDLPVMDSAADVKALELHLRPLAAGMHPSGDLRRRQLLLEGRALYSYVLREPPKESLMRAYVRAVESLRNGASLSLPNSLTKWPSLLAAVDQGIRDDSGWMSEFRWRLGAATRMAEATPEGARRFLGNPGRHGVVPVLLRIARAVMTEVAWRAVMPVVRPFVHVVSKRSNCGLP